MAGDVAAAWTAVERLGRERRPDGSPPWSIRPLFAADPARFARFSRRGGDLLLDFSKTAIDQRALSALLALAEAAGVEAWRDAMARGEAVNATEGRRALHMALRAPQGAVPANGGPEVAAEIQATLARMAAFTRAVHAGAMRSAGGEPFAQVLNIGIGGSDLGPAMAYQALAGPDSPLPVRYLSNVDGHAWRELLPSLDPRRLLVLIASKTFTTQETMANARLVKAWLAEALGGEDRAAQHLVALSSNLSACAAFGIPPERVFAFGDYIGGRFSLWSAIGLSLALGLGWERFAALLAGARRMDEHFLTAPLAENLPVLLALVEVWHVNALGLRRRAVLPYDERLRRLPAHLQQLEMESLGKRVSLAGEPLARHSGPVVFGEPGTSAQHSFMQLLHQGSEPVPADVILIARPDHPWRRQHLILLAHGLAQTEALLSGRDADSLRAEMMRAGAGPAEIERLLPHRVLPGERPSVTILLPRLDPTTLGQLIALYEHKVAVLGALWGINPFDQWGVELGKQLAAPLLEELESGRPDPARHDASTLGLLEEILRLQREA
ncbi:MAG: glucose-6-phosphate isomerase [Rhodovarius sp.]|nr:glucose-6-phosphate isomerase [Rhodovarius sp.]MCX7932455.1 glucose-6-phosphate isomerase [Rhodovarius sp.]MDW8314574.1 glucose-6-phosphate isomerase [Rhodovarius sp.]